MTGKLTVLYVPLDAVGHVNGCIGSAQVLIEAGHRVVFAVNDQWAGRLEPYGIEEHLIVDEDRPKGVDQVKYFAKMILDMGNINETPPLEKIANWKDVSVLLAMTKKMDKVIAPIIEFVKPNVIVIDQFVNVPAIEQSGIPVIWSWSCNPLFPLEYHAQSIEKLPPAASGYSVFGDKSDWKHFRDVRDNGIRNELTDYSDYLVSRGCQPLVGNSMRNTDNCLNIYGFPQELDYTDVRPLPKNFMRFDNLKRTEGHLPFEVPVPLRGRPGKLIYFSMGSMGAADVKNMKRLVTILSKSKHRFIISKGPLHEEYDLPVNMWGAATLPQIQVLPLVDLVVTHGGNNTITETFYFGKPMVVLPLFGDQYDNAQRVVDKGFGIRLDTYRCTENELLNAIEKLLNDKPLNEKLRTISSRIQSDNSIAKLPEIIEDFIRNKNKYLD